MTTQDDTALFRQAMADVAPLKHTPRVQPDPIRPRRRKQSPPVAEYGNVASADEVAPLEEWETPGGHVFWQRASLRPQEVRRLKRGDFNTSWCIDLHGMTRDEAAQALQQFVVQAQQAGVRHLLVITGKGYHSEGGISVIRTLTQQTLQRLPMVLAYTSAQPTDGGTGALYVFLRAPK